MSKPDASLSYQIDFAKANRPMSQESKPLLPQVQFVLVALCSGASSTVIALLALLMFPHISGSESMVWAIAFMIAAMVAAPAAMGIGVAYFMSRQSSREPTQNH